MFAMGGAAIGTALIGFVSLLFARERYCYAGGGGLHATFSTHF